MLEYVRVWLTATAESQRIVVCKCVMKTSFSLWDSDQEALCCIQYYLGVYATSFDLVVPKKQRLHLRLCKLIKNLISV